MSRRRGDHRAPQKRAARHFCRAAFDALHETAKQSEGRTSVGACFLLRRHDRHRLANGPDPKVHCRTPPLVGFASLSEVIPARGSAVIGSALPLRRRLAPRPWGLPDRRRVRSFENGRSASPRVGPPSEYDRVSCRSPVGQRRLPWSLSPLQRMRTREPTYPGFASSRFWCGYRVSHPPAASFSRVPPTG